MDDRSGVEGSGTTVRALETAEIARLLVLEYGPLNAAKWGEVVKTMSDFTTI